MFEVICHLITGEIVNNIIYKIKLKIVKTPSDGKVHMLEGYDSNTVCTSTLHKIYCRGRLAPYLDNNAGETKICEAMV